MTVFWTNAALEQLLALHAYLQQRSPEHAERTVDAITRRSEQIARSPYAGRMVPERHREDLREVIERPYRIVYRIKSDQVHVLAVFHSAQQFPRKLTGE